MVKNIVFSFPEFFAWWKRFSATADGCSEQKDGQSSKSDASPPFSLFTEKSPG
jgi:hypothetical protein